MSELSRSASIIRRSSLPGPRKCCCPTKSSSVRGRIRAASGRAKVRFSARMSSKRSATMHPAAEEFTTNTPRSHKDSQRKQKSIRQDNRMNSIQELILIDPVISSNALLCGPLCDLGVFVVSAFLLLLQRWDQFDNLQRTHPDSVSFT